MKQEHISDALNLLEDDIIEETDNVRKNKKNPQRGLTRWGVLVACLCLLVISTVLASRLTKEEKKGPTELPLLTISDLNTEGMGHESYLDYDISQRNTYNPWNEALAIDTLPVYKNGSYNIHGIPYGLDKDAMVKRLTSVAKILDMVILDTEYEYSGTDNITDIMATTASATIHVTADGGISIGFNEGVPLPEQYSFTFNDTTDEEAEAVLSYLIEKYSKLLSFSQPQKVLSGYYNIYGDFGHYYQVYDGSGNPVEDILNYTFNHVGFVPDDNGNLGGISIDSGLSCAEKIGDYPIITSDEALQLLLKGNYITSVPYELPGEKYVAKVKLVYRNSRLDETLIPYYRFYVEIPDMQLDNGLKEYGAYYVPAVEPQYIENMPIYNGDFN